MMSDTKIHQPKIPWDDILEAVYSEQHLNAFDSISGENLQFIINPINRDFIVESVLTSLINSDDDNATATHANEVADLVITLAKEFNAKKGN